MLPIKEALQLAQERGLDLIEIAPQAKPPVVRLMDYGKYLYTKEQQERKRRAKERKDVLKTIRLTFGMSMHDMSIRLKKAQEFLQTSGRLQIEILLKGRQKTHPEIAEQKIEEFLRLLPESVKVISREKTPNGLRIIVAK